MNRSRTLAGLSQDWIWAASGCVRSLFLVLFSYLSNATLRTDWNVEEEVEGVGDTWDIGSKGEFSRMIRKWVVYIRVRAC